MNREESQELRVKNNCATCERRGSYAIGCQIFKAEPENCWAHTTDKDWRLKVERATKVYSALK